MHAHCTTHAATGRLLAPEAPVGSVDGRTSGDTEFSHLDPVVFRNGPIGKYCQSKETAYMLVSTCFQRYEEKVSATEGPNSRRQELALAQLAWGS